MTPKDFASLFPSQAFLKQITEGPIGSVLRVMQDHDRHAQFIADEQRMMRVMAEPAFLRGIENSAVRYLQEENERFSVIEKAMNAPFKFLEEQARIVSSPIEAIIAANKRLTERFRSPLENYLQSVSEIEYPVYFGVADIASSAMSETMDEDCRDDFASFLQRLRAKDQCFSAWTSPALEQERIEVFEEIKSDDVGSLHQEEQANWFVNRWRAAKRRAFAPQLLLAECATVVTLEIVTVKYGYPAGSTTAWLIGKTIDHLRNRMKGETK